MVGNGGALDQPKIRRDLRLIVDRKRFSVRHAPMSPRYHRALAAAPLVLSAGLPIGACEIQSNPKVVEVVLFVEPAGAGEYGIYAAIEVAYDKDDCPRYAALVAFYDGRSLPSARDKNDRLHRCRTEGAARRIMKTCHPQYKEL